MSTLMADRLRMETRYDAQVGQVGGRQATGHEIEQFLRGAADFGGGLLRVAGTTAAGAAGGPLAAHLANQVMGAAGMGGAALNGVGVGGYNEEYAFQLALIEEQRRIQNQSQLVTMLSNTSKAQHDAAMNVINSMK